MRRCVRAGDRDGGVAPTLVSLYTAGRVGTTCHADLPRQPPGQARHRRAGTPSVVSRASSVHATSTSSAAPSLAVDAA